MYREGGQLDDESQEEAQAGQGLYISGQKRASADQAGHVEGCHTTGSNAHLRIHINQTGQHEDTAEESIYEELE